MSLKNKVISLLLCLFGTYAIIEYTVCVFRAKTASIPAGKQPPFRWENGQHSDVIAATIPVNSASA